MTPGVLTAGRLLLLALLGDEDAVRAVAGLFAEYAELPRAVLAWPSSVALHPTPTGDDLPELFLEYEQPDDGQED